MQIICMRQLEIFSGCPDLSFLLWRVEEELVIRRGYLTVYNKLLVFSVSGMSILCLYEYSYILSIEDNLNFISFNVLLHVISHEHGLSQCTFPSGSFLQAPVHQLSVIWTHPSVMYSNLAKALLCQSVNNYNTNTLDLIIRLWIKTLRKRQENLKTYLR